MPHGPTAAAVHAKRTASARLLSLAPLLTLPDVPVGIPSSFDEQMNLMFDTVAVWMQKGECIRAAE